VSEKPEKQLHVTEVGETEHGDEVEVHMPVMTLRDWFAGQAMYSLSVESRDKMEPDSVAEWCFSVADAMLKGQGKV
jgi:hypothetical protein